MTCYDRSHGVMVGCTLLRVCATMTVYSTVCGTVTRRCKRTYKTLYWHMLLPAPSANMFLNDLHERLYRVRLSDSPAQTEITNNSCHGVLLLIRLKLLWNIESIYSAFGCTGVLTKPPSRVRNGQGQSEDVSESSATIRTKRSQYITQLFHH